MRSGSVSFALLVAAGVMGCSTASSPVERTTLARFHLESREAIGPRTILPQSETEITVSAKPVFTEFDLTSVAIVETELGKCLSFQLTAAAARDLYRLSVMNVGQRLVLTVDGKAMGARRIEEPIDDGVLLVFIEMADDQLPALKTALVNTSAEFQRLARKL
jgi:hypothetical protein